MFLVALLKLNFILPPSVGAFKYKLMFFLEGIRSHFFFQTNSINFLDFSLTRSSLWLYVSYVLHGIFIVLAEVFEVFILLVIE